MDLAEYISILTKIKRECHPTQKNKTCMTFCTQFYEAFVKYVSVKLPTETVLKCLASTVEVYGQVRPRIPADKAWDQLGHVIFIEVARVVLGLDFQKLDDAAQHSPKAVFKQSLHQSHLALRNEPTAEYFLTLQWLAKHGWTHPTLQIMMAGGDIQDQTAQKYLLEDEFPEIFRLRVDMLMENGCDDFALNLATWCCRSPKFVTDAYVRQAQLLLQLKLNKQEEFHHTCWEIWQEKCCLSLHILRTILQRGKEEEKRPLLTLTQTFLIHDWMKPDKYCCTEPLLKFFLSLERERVPNNEDFIQSVSKMDQLASSTKQNQILVRSLSALFPGEFLQFSMECMLKAMRQDRLKLDNARVYMKDDLEADQAADSLAASCLVIASMFTNVPRMQVAANLTSFYMDPSESLYHSIKSLLVDNPPPSKPVKPPPPPKPPKPLRLPKRPKSPKHIGRYSELSSSESEEEYSEEEEDEDEVEEEDDDWRPPIMEPPTELDRHTFFELLQALETLRPSTFDLYSDWPEIQKVLRTNLEDAGFGYNQKNDNFITYEERIKRKRKNFKKYMAKKAREALKESQKKSGSGELQSDMNKLALNGPTSSGAQSQTVLPGGSQPVNQSFTGELDTNLQKDSVGELPDILDITLDELQQVLDSSNQPSGSGTGQTAEEIQLNSIKEFLKEGDMEMCSQPAQNVVQSVPSLPGSIGNSNQPQTVATTSQPQPPSVNSLNTPERPIKSGSTESPKPSTPSTTASTPKTPITPIREFEEPTDFRCKHCQKVYEGIKQRRRHQEWLCKYKNKEKDFVNPSAKDSPIKEDTMIDRDDHGNFICTVCLRKFNSYLSVRLHQSKKHNMTTKGEKPASVELTGIPSGMTLKACSVKLDRMEDAPQQKVTKKEDAKVDKPKMNLIDKLKSKKYTPGYFSSNNKKEHDTPKTKAPQTKAKKPNMFEDSDNYVQISNTDSSSTDEYSCELVSTIEVDMNTGDAQVESLIPTDKPLPVLCDYCGAMCENHAAMILHKDTCILSPKKIGAQQTTKTTDNAKAVLFQKPGESKERSDKATLVMSSTPQSISNTNIVHAIPYDKYVASVPTHPSPQVTEMAPVTSISPSTSQHVDTQPVQPRTPKVTNTPPVFTSKPQPKVKVDAPHTEQNTSQNNQETITVKKVHVKPRAPIQLKIPSRTVHVSTNTSTKKKKVPTATLR